MLCGGPVLLEVAVAVPELVGELGLVEVARPVRHLVAGAGGLQRPFRPRERGHARLGLAENAVTARLDGVQKGQDGVGRGGADALLGHPCQLYRLAAVAQVDGLPTHGDQDEAAVGPVARGLGQP